MTRSRTRSPLAVGALTVGLISFPTPAQDRGASGLGVDASRLTREQTATLLELMEESPCGCGCGMGLLECRYDDPECQVSRRITRAAIDALAEGKTRGAVIAEMDVARTGNRGQVPLLSTITDGESPRSAAGRPMEERPKAFSEPLRRGPEDAAVRIVEFSDYECPYCRGVHGLLQQVLERYPEDVKLVVKHFPLRSHSHARRAAEASLAAAAQGKFWEMHAALFDAARDLTPERIDAIAAGLGLDMERFRSELDAGTHAPRVEADLEEGVAFGVRSVPTLLLNGRRVRGPRTLDGLSRMIDDELARLAE